MTICINCNTQNSDQENFCQSCGSNLLIEWRYRAIRQLGVGGFGTTYEVKDNQEQGIAKVLKVLRHNSPKAIELFKREADFLSSNNYPGIPKADSESYFEFEPKDSQQPLHCLVMEKIEGDNLKEYIQKLGKPLKGKIALRCLKELVEILDKVHSQDIIHRDIKPHNIMFQPDGKLVLIDFGAVVDGGIGGEETATATVASGTQTATNIGSKLYEAPEQRESKAIKQSDIYSLGRTFIYLLTAREPNDPDMYDLFNDQLNWQEYAKEVSPQLADLINLMIKRVPSQRPESTQVILQKLQGMEKPQKKGEDIEIELEISEVEAAAGTQKEVNISRFINVNGVRQKEDKKLMVTIPAGAIEGQKII